ncbi:MAG: hypothetical protein K6C05_00015 [Anaerovibrio sp.]|uniref:hypothetical protein n=1 Tax=Anaerovibrio sp. TaxID=1872532 RepID=UPI0025DEAA9A|nr:hypothetical protein [Anaerovibrio sp.]MCR5175215.1 hypothetical protein [Anaerovibrio sp.]
MLWDEDHEVYENDDSVIGAVNKEDEDYGPGIDDSDDECVYDPGIDCNNTSGPDGIECGGTNEDNAVHNTLNNNTYQENTQNDSAEDYNFGYGGNRHNRERGARFHGLGRWRHRG